MPPSDLTELEVRAYAGKFGLTVDQVRAMAVVPLHLLAGVMLLDDDELHRLAGI